MGPPVDPQTSETLGHAVEALKRSGQPLTSGKILELIPSPSRVKPAVLEELLKKPVAEGMLAIWPPRQKGQAQRYWTRTPEAAVETGLMELLADAVESPSGAVKKLTSRLAGFSDKERGALVESCLEALASAGKLYRHPVRGRTRYGARPAAAAGYVKALRKEVDALAKKLAPAGVTREQILAALADDARGDRLSERMLDHLKAKGRVVSIGELRESVAPAPEDKSRFDDAVLSLWRQRRVFLDRHDYPQSMSDSDRNHDLVLDGKGNYYVMIGLRDADDQPVS